MIYLLRKNIKTKRPSDKLDHTKLGPFKIEKKLGSVTFKQKVEKGIRIYSGFHISLLEPALEKVRSGLIKIDKRS